MKKLLFILVLVAVFSISAFGQSFTFRGIPWGSTREKVIEILGKPDIYPSNPDRLNNADSYSYAVSVSGYLARLDIYFDTNGMSQAHYNFGWFQNLDATQMNIAFMELLSQLKNSYGSHNEIIMPNDLGTIQSNEGLRIFVWHFNNFHVLLSTIYENAFGIGYLSSAVWNNNQEEAIKTGQLLRFPNNEL